MTVLLILFTYMAFAGLALASYYKHQTRKRRHPVRRLKRHHIARRPVR
jgi:hypothetical protein